MPSYDARSSHYGIDSQATNWSFCGARESRCVLSNGYDQGMRSSELRFDIFSETFQRI